MFVAIHCTKYLDEVGQLMTYAQKIHGIAKSCGDDAAISYDEQFRQWRQVAPRACPWERKNSQLFHDAIVQGLDLQTKFKKQPFRSFPLSRNIVSHTITRAPVTKATHVNMHTYANIAPIDTLGFNAQNIGRETSTHQNLSPMITKNSYPCTQSLNSQLLHQLMLIIYLYTFKAMIQCY